MNISVDEAIGFLRMPSDRDLRSEADAAALKEKRAKFAERLAVWESDPKFRCDMLFTSSSPKSPPPIAGAIEREELPV
jgi:hypothetical protein